MKSTTTRCKCEIGTDITEANDEHTKNGIHKTMRGSHTQVANDAHSVTHTHTSYSSVCEIDVQT